MNITERIRSLCEENRITIMQLESELGFSNGAISKWKKSSPKVANLEKVAQYFGVPVDYLLGNSTITKTKYNSNKGVRIPVLGRVVAGIPIDAIEEIIDYEEIPREMAATGDFFALQVKGDSMLPTLKDGDIVIVKKQSTVDSGDIAIVLVNGNEATIKEVKESPAGITLIGHNVAVFTPHFYSNKEIEELPVRVIGKAVEVRRKL